MTPTTGFVFERRFPWVLRFIYLFGVPAAISVYLIWIMASRVEGMQRETLDLMRAHELNTQYNTKANGEQIERLDRIYRLTQIMCVNGAKDDSARARCFSVDRTINP